MRQIGQEYVLNFQTVLEKDPVGSKVLERNVFVSNSEIKANKEQPDHEESEQKQYDDHSLQSKV